MNKIVIIVGPTATGKTDLALKLAEKFNGEIISADSRQVYKHMNLSTAKDIPEGSTWHKEGFWQTPKKIKIYGYDLVNPNEDFSVAQFIDYAKKIIKNIQSKNKLPIIAGGTGLYIKGLIDDIPTSTVAPNEKIRQLYSQKSPDELFQILSTLYPFKAANLNSSDRANPRRLIRAIEIALSDAPPADLPRQSTAKTGDYLLIGLSAPKEILHSRIQSRINSRANDDFAKEVKKLLSLDPPATPQALSSIGYAQWLSYLNEEITKSDAITSWQTSERQYIKKQLVWFKKEKRIKWFDITKNNYYQKIIQETAEFLKK